jgi:hypothetical protein
MAHTTEQCLTEATFLAEVLLNRYGDTISCEFSDGISVVLNVTTAASAHKKCYYSISFSAYKEGHGYVDLCVYADNETVQISRNDGVQKWVLGGLYNKVAGPTAERFAPSEGAEIRSDKVGRTRGPYAVKNLIKKADKKFDRIHACTSEELDAIFKGKDN